jgi:hypothetical protein
MNDKKKVLVICWMLAGIAIVIASLLLDSSLMGIALGLSGGMIGSALVFSIKSRKSPEQLRADEKRLEHIRKDERKIMLRDKSGRYAYIIGMVCLLIITTVFFILRNLGIVFSVDTMISVYSAFVIFEYVLGMVIFSYLEKRY